MSTMQLSDRKRRVNMAGVGMVLFLVPSALIALPIFLIFALVYLGFEVPWLNMSDSPDPEPSWRDGLFSLALMVLTLVEHVGLGMVLWALFVQQFRRPWFYRWMQVATVAMCFSGGSIILALVVSRYLHYKKAEFRAEIVPPHLPVPPPLAERGGAGVTSVPSASCDNVGALTSADPAAALQRLKLLEAENARLKAVVAAQALDIHALKEGAASR